MHLALLHHLKGAGLCRHRVQNTGNLLALQAPISHYWNTWQSPSLQIAINLYCKMHLALLHHRKGPGLCRHRAQNTSNLLAPDALHLKGAEYRQPSDSTWNAGWSVKWWKHQNIKIAKHIQKACSRRHSQNRQKDTQNMLCVPGQRNRILAIALKKIRWSTTYSSKCSLFFVYLILVGPGLVLEKGSLPWISPTILLLLLCESNYSVINTDLGKPMLANGNIYTQTYAAIYTNRIEGYTPA